jgi:hypothetical protein
MRTEKLIRLDSAELGKKKILDRKWRQEKRLKETLKEFFTTVEFNLPT